VGRRTAILSESRHPFRFTIMVLSSELPGEPKLRIRVSPTCPDLAANANLCVETRPFVSRARMPDKNERKRKAAAETTVYRSCNGVGGSDETDTTVWRSCNGVDGSDEDDEDASPQYVSLCAFPEGPDLEEEQEEEEAPRTLANPNPDPNPSTRTLALALARQPQWPRQPRRSGRPAAPRRPASPRRPLARRRPPAPRQP